MQASRCHTTEQTATWSKPELDQGNALLSTEHSGWEAVQISVWVSVHNSLLVLPSVAFHFCFGFGEFPAWERWLFALWAGDGGADREVLGHPQRVPSSSDQMLNFWRCQSVGLYISE